MTSEYRLRDGDQQLPVAGSEFVEDSVIQRIREHAENIHWAGSKLTERVEAESQKRFDLGIQRYGFRLMTFNGRDSRQDALEELLDAHHYLIQGKLERRNNGRWGNLVLDLIFEVTHEIMAEEAKQK